MRSRPDGERAGPQSDVSAWRVTGGTATQRALTFSARPAFSTAATESPPPMMVVAPAEEAGGVQLMPKKGSGSKQPLQVHGPARWDCTVRRALPAPGTGRRSGGPLATRCLALVTGLPPSPWPVTSARSSAMALVPAGPRRRAGGRVAAGARPAPDNHMQRVRRQGHHKGSRRAPPRWAVRCRPHRPRTCQTQTRPWARSTGWSCTRTAPS